MGNCISYFFKENSDSLNAYLIQDVYCPRCRRRYMSNYDYNKHIVSCNESYGDM